MVGWGGARDWGWGGERCLRCWAARSPRHCRQWGHGSGGGAIQQLAVPLPSVFSPLTWVAEPTLPHGWAWEPAGPRGWVLTRIREAALGPTLHCLSLEITCVSAWFVSSLCSSVLHCLLFFSITRMAMFIPFSSYYFHIVNFFFFEFSPHSQPSPLRESLKRKEHIIQTLHITNKGLGGSE